MIIKQKGVMPRHCETCWSIFYKSAGTHQKICYKCQEKNRKKVGIKAKAWWANQRELKFKNKGVLKI